MTLLDPHPSHNVHFVGAPNAKYYDLATGALGGFPLLPLPIPVGWFVEKMYLTAQKAQDDPEVVVPKIVDFAELYFQQTKVEELTGPERIMNFWGEPNVINLSAIEITRIELNGRSHTGVHKHYLESEIPKLSPLNPTALSQGDLPPAFADDSWTQAMFVSATGVATNGETVSDVDLLYPALVDDRAVAEEIVDLLTRAMEADQAGDAQGTVAALKALEGYIELQADHFTSPQSFFLFTNGVETIVSGIVPPIVVGADAGGGPHVRVFDTVTGQERLGFFAFDRGFKGGVRVATGDVNGDRVADIIAGAGPGGGPAVRVFDGASGEMISQFFAFDRSFRGGIHVATGDVDGDGTPEIIVGAGPGGRPAVRVFNAITGAQIGETVFAFPRAFRGGVNVATGDADGDGTDEIIVGAGPGGSPAVRVFNGVTGTQIGETIFAFDRGFRGGVYVAAGDLDGNSTAEIVVGAGEGGGPAVRVFEGGTGAQIGETMFAFPRGFRGGVRVATGDLNLDGRADIYVAAGPGGGPHVGAFRGLDKAPLGGFFVYPQFRGGLFVAGDLAGLAGDLGGGSALRTSSQPAPQSPKQQPLSESQLAPIVAAGIARLEAASLPEDLRGPLASVQFFVTDLRGDLLGLARPGRILLDDDAAGHGWFIDYSPLLDEEFFEDGSQLAARDGRAAGRIDLLTVVLHELGHALGLDDLDDRADHDGLMSAVLPPGVRRTLHASDLDLLFERDDAWDLMAV